MANFKSVTSTVCGASKILNDMLNDADKFADGLLEDLEVGLKPAADLIREGQKRFDEAEATLKGLVPKLPTLKSLGLQDEVDALKLLAGDAIAYADKVASIAAAFGNLDFEKIMEAVCEADNKKIIDGKVVTGPKNVTMQKGPGTVETFIEAGLFKELGDSLSVGGIISQAENLVDDVKEAVDNPFGVKSGVDLVTENIKKNYTESVAKIQDETAPGGQLQVAIEKAGYTLTKPPVNADIKFEINVNAEDFDEDGNYIGP